MDARLQPCAVAVALASSVTRRRRRDMAASLRARSVPCGLLGARHGRRMGHHALASAGAWASREAECVSPTLHPPLPLTPTVQPPLLAVRCAPPPPRPPRPPSPKTHTSSSHLQLDKVGDDVGGAPPARRAEDAHRHHGGVQRGRLTADQGLQRQHQRRTSHLRTPPAPSPRPTQSGPHGVRGGAGAVLSAVAGGEGEVWRLTTGSAPMCGMAPCAPRPCSRSVKRSDAAMMMPACARAHTAQRHDNAR